MKKIYKYQLEVTDTQVVTLSYGAQILTADMQGNNLCLWALVDPGEDKAASRTIDIFGTGHPIDDSIPRDYINTFQIDDGNLIFHVFARTT